MLLLPASARAAPTWLPSVVASPEDQEAVDVMGGADAQGRTTVLWREYGTDVLFVATRALGAAGFNGGTSISAPGAGLPAFAVGPSGLAVAAWRRSVNGKLVIEAATHVPNAIGFGPAQVLSDPTVNSSDPQVAIDAAGNATVVWRDTGVEVATRPVGAAAFSAPKPISAAGGDAPQVAANAAGDVAIVWRFAKGADTVVQVARRKAGAPGYTLPDDLSGTGVAKDPQVAVDGAGAVTVVWTRSYNGTRIAQAATSPAGKGSFTEPEELSGLGPNDNDPRAATEVSVAVNGPGDTVVGWRWSDSVGSHMQAVTRPAGATLFAATPQDLAADESGVTQDLDLAMGEDGHALAGWYRSAAPAAVLVAERPAGATAFAAAQPHTTPGHSGFLPGFAFDADGDTFLFWGERQSGTSTVVRSSVQDGAPPALSGFTVPALADRGQAAPMSVLAKDVWSPPATIVWSFGDGGTALGGSVTHAYAEPGAYTVTVTAVDAVGNSREQTAVVQVPEPAASPTPTQGPATFATPTPAPSATPTPAVDTIAPAVSAPSLTPRRPRRGRSARLRYTLSEAARVAVTVRRVRPRRKVLSLTAPGGTGVNRRTLPTKRLRPGRYRVVLVATDAAGNRSVAVRLRLRVVKRRS